VPERFVSLLAARMRSAGATVGVGEVLGAHRALAAVPPAAARDALRAALCSSRRDLEAYDAAWASLVAAPEPEPLLDALMNAAKTALPRAAIPATMAMQPAAAASAPLPAAWSAEELLLDKDFAAYTEAERAAARAVLQRLARRGARRLSRRTRSSRRRHDTPDLRAMIRGSLRHGGEVVQRRWRAPASRLRPLVLVVDVSGSMAPYARMLLAYVHAAVAARRRVEAYALGTRLTRITRELQGRDPDRALARLTGAVVDLGGGTRIGDALATLNRVHGRRLGRGAVVVILSDGWDRGDPGRMASEMARLRRSSHRLIWLNPLAADPAYAPLTRGMQAALPHTDHLLAGNSLASLQALADLMEEIT